MLDFDRTLADSHQHSGPLGAVVFVVEKVLELAGAEPDERREFTRLAQEYFPELSDEECNVLCDVLFRRISEAEKLRTDGRWYA